MVNHGGFYQLDRQEGPPAHATAAQTRGPLSLMSRFVCHRYLRAGSSFHLAPSTNHSTKMIQMVEYRQSISISATDRQVTLGKFVKVIICALLGTMCVSEVFGEQPLVRFARADTACAVRDIAEDRTRHARTLVGNRLNDSLRAPVESPATTDMWSTISPYFTPPRQWHGKTGDYKSPLEFADGTRVQTAEDWGRRRAEIKHEWESLLGKWPVLITAPQVEILESVRRDEMTQHQVRFSWLPGEQTTGYLLIPDGEEPRPAVLTVFYEPETAIGLGTANRDFALQLARRGFVTLSIGTTDASKAKTYSLYYPSMEDAQVAPLSMLGYAAANAWYVLAERPEVDANRIGIVGHSFGGKWAMFASCLFDKFACAVWSDPGIVFDESRESVNYWEPWYLGYHPKPWRKRGLITSDNPAHGLYPKLAEAGRDLHELHALMAPRPFLVSGGSEDPPRRWVPLNHTVEVNRILGYTNRVGMANRPDHAPNDESNEIIYAFFTHFLKPSCN